MGTLDFIRSRYAVLWLLALVSSGVLVWWLLFRTAPPAALGPVNPDEVKVDALDPRTAPATASSRPEPNEAYLSEASFEVTSRDGTTRLAVRASRARKEASKYLLQNGTLNFVNGDTSLELTISDATYLEEAGVAYVEGTMQGRLVDTNQSFAARRLRWNQLENSILAEEVSYRGANVSVRGERMRIILPAGSVQFEGPVSASVSKLL